jgi:hypothetical protein
MTKKYISKGEWFEKGTEAKLLVPIEDDAGLFRGIKDGSIDEEQCMLDEFEIIEDDGLPPSYVVLKRFYDGTENEPNP